MGFCVLAIQYGKLRLCFCFGAILPNTDVELLIIQDSLHSHPECNLYDGVQINTHVGGMQEYAIRQIRYPLATTTLLKVGGLSESPKQYGSGLIVYYKSYMYSWLS